MRVSCSACADWPRSLQKHKQRATLNNPAFSPTQVTPGHDAERQLTREKQLLTHSTCLSMAARACSSEKHAPLQSAKRKQLTSGRNFFKARRAALARKVLAPAPRAFGDLRRRHLKCVLAACAPRRRPSRAASRATRLGSSRRAPSRGGPRCYSSGAQARCCPRSTLAVTAGYTERRGRRSAGLLAQRRWCPGPPHVPRPAGGERGSRRPREALGRRVSWRGRRTARPGIARKPRFLASGSSRRCAAPRPHGRSKSSGSTAPTTWASSRSTPRPSRTTPRRAR